jgi:hypothetical protein
MTKNQRLSFWHFLERYRLTEDTPKEIQERVLHRFNPEMQYTVITVYEGVKNTYQAYMFADKLWINENTFIEPKFILSYENTNPDFK